VQQFCVLFGIKDLIIKKNFAVGTSHLKEFVHGGISPLPHHSFSNDRKKAESRHFSQL
jgi:hypothetical protein